jgi:hypothetical protein
VKPKPKLLVLTSTYPRWPDNAEPGFVLAQFFSVWLVVCRSRPDVVHAHWLIPQGLVIALLSLVSGRVPPVLVTTHGADLYALPGASGAGSNVASRGEWR